MKTKKGQGGEMIGMLVIIILILVLVALYFRFASKPKNTIIEESITSIQLDNFLQAYASYTLCGDKNVLDAVTSCYEKNEICGEDSCELLEKETFNILNVTFTKELARGKLYVAIKDTDKEPAEVLLKVPDLKFKCKRTIVQNKDIPLSPITISIIQCVS
jgi:hypothetical protein